MSDDEVDESGTILLDPTRRGAVPRLVMIVEDSDLDATLLKRVLGRLRPEVEVVRTRDGLDALELLESRRPDLIIMDIRMPRMSGREALVEIKMNAALKRIPVIMMSTSSDDVDIEYCYDNHANAYVAKSFSVKEGKAMENLVKFWLGTAELAA